MINHIKKWIPSSPRKWIAWAGLFFLLYLVGLLIPEGFDWTHHFSTGSLHTIWTPWTRYVVKIVNWPLVVALTFFAIIVRSYRYNKSPIPMALAILSLPTIWVLFMGNIDGLVLLGLICMPWGVPLASMKPQLAAFALLARKKSILAGILWGLITVLIWGLWPLNFQLTLTQGWKAEWVQDISLFPWGAILALPLLWFSRGDEDLLMAAGSFITPHLFPYHFILLMPALARLKPAWMVAAWLVSWTPLIANWVGPIGWRMGNLLAAVMWAGIFFSTRQVKFRSIFRKSISAKST